MHSRSIQPVKQVSSLFVSLTCFQQPLHFCTGLVIVDENFETQVLKALEQLTCITVRAIAYIHPLNTKNPPKKQKHDHSHNTDIADILYILNCSSHIHISLTKIIL